MQHLGGYGALLGPAGQGRFQGAGTGAVLPPAAKVGFEDGNIVGKILLDLAEKIFGLGKNQFWVVPSGVPILNDLGQPRFD